MAAGHFLPGAGERTQEEPSVFEAEFGEKALWKWKLVETTLESFK